MLVQQRQLHYLRLWNSKGYRKGIERGAERNPWYEMG